MNNDTICTNGCRPVAPSFVRNDERGLFVEIVNEGPWETIIHGSMKTSAEMGNHYHRECRAYFYLMSGRAQIMVRHLIDNSVDEVELHAGQGVYLLPFQTHLIRYLEDSDFILLKSYRYRNDNPDMFFCKVEL